ncbi:hypothetical protein GCM10009117_13290 [Gangjinia marincola]|uniref:ATP-binding protein n=1 Tax=Gangjinia marincola TaxID=578463 RepID=A0ABP3XV42_9FLAO
MNEINTTFLRLSKRAETKDNSYLVNTFVNVGPLFTILSNRDHEILYGRRGTGKTHAFAYLGNSLKNEGDIVINVDLRTIGSNGGIFSDSSLPITQRATRLLIDTLTYVIDGIIDEVISDQSDKYDLSIISPLADSLWEAITEIIVGGNIEIETDKTSNRTENKEIGTSLNISLKNPSLDLSDKSVKSDNVSKTEKVKRQGVEHHRIHFSSVFKSLQLMSQKLAVHIWILFDEWAEIPQELQPYLSELIRRTILPNTGITVKIAAIEQRTNLSLFDANHTRIGIEEGADISTSQNLDEYMVFDNDEGKSLEFFKELLFHHFNGINDSANIIDSNDLINRAFTQSNTFHEFVRASEGVPRDAINILGIAATKASDSKISMDNIRNAARIWFSRGKEKAISTNENAFNLLQWIRDKVIGERNSRAFLLRTNHKDPLIDYLFDARVIHMIKENVSGKDEPGARYNVYSIDYGCYVDLMNTNNAPKGLFEATEQDSENSIYVDVPRNDYRAIRRAILDLSEFYENVA